MVALGLDELSLAVDTNPLRPPRPHRLQIVDEERHSRLASEGVAALREPATSIPQP
jgi:hypothetical protein